MARCKDCIHYAVCGKQRFMVQIDVHTFDEYNQVDGVEKYCYEYNAPSDDVALRAEVAREIFGEVWNIFNKHYYACHQNEDGDECDAVTSYLSYVAVEYTEADTKPPKGE